ncbi:YIF1-domain-containing protein [Pelagophyceae sp. CCMP2097]|nr:YIF1-domain-containing protein [Pelagophyceae sp. CCMP2097]
MSYRGTAPPPNYNPNFHSTPPRSHAYGGDTFDGFGQQQQQPFGQQPFGQQPPAAPQPYGQQQVFGQQQPYGQPFAQQQLAGQPQQPFAGQQPPQQPQQDLYGSESAAQATVAVAAMFAGDSSMGQQFFQKQRHGLVSRYMPGVESFWTQLQCYFAVSHAYVALKLRTLAFPYRKKAWRRKSADQQRGPDSFSLPVDDDNAPDAYIPCMSFVTFLVVTAYVKGTVGQFTPDLLVAICTSCLGFQAVEMTMYAVGLYAMGAPLSCIDLACYTGYKYVALCANTLLGFAFGKRAYYGSLAYTAMAASYFMLKTMAQNVPAKTAAASPPREAVVVGMGLLQGLSIWFLGFVET